MTIILLCIVVLIIGRFAARMASRAEELCPANAKAKLRPLVLGSRIAWALAFACLIPIILGETVSLLTSNKLDHSLGDALVFAFCFVGFLCLGVIASLLTIADASLRMRTGRGKL